MDKIHLYESETPNYAINFIITNCNCFYIEFRYFEQDDDDDGGNSSNTLAYIPAPGSPSWDLQNAKKDSDSEDDPLDAFMAGLEVGIFYNSYSNYK